jgi:MFS family permease
MFPAPYNWVLAYTTSKIISHNTPVSERPRYTSVVSAGMGITMVIGPFLGGVFADKLTWRWCFWINLPLGGLTMITTAWFVQVPPQTKTKVATWRELVEQMDLLGNVIFLPCSICLLLALQWGGTTYPWHDWRIALLLCVLSLTGVFWGYCQFRKGDDATVTMRLLKMRSVLAAMWFGFCLFGMLYLQT